MNIQVAVTGTEWIGKGLESIESVIRRMFDNAQREICITAYAISTRAELLFELLDCTLSKGVKVTIIINNYSNLATPVQRRLYNLNRQYKHFALYNFFDADGADLHAKVIVVDRTEAIVGSSNYSLRGLLRNHELALYIKNKTAGEVAQAIDRILNSQYVNLISCKSENI